jgi:hypothetical protein
MFTVVCVTTSGSLVAVKISAAALSATCWRSGGRRPPSAASRMSACRMFRRGPERGRWRAIKCGVWMVSGPTPPVMMVSLTVRERCRPERRNIDGQLTCLADGREAAVGNRQRAGVQDVPEYTMRKRCHGTRGGGLVPHRAHMDEYRDAVRALRAVAIGVFSPTPPSRRRPGGGREESAGEGPVFRSRESRGNSTTTRCDTGGCHSAVRRRRRRIIA